MKTNSAGVIGRRVIAALRDVIHLQDAAKGPIEGLPMVWGVKQLGEVSIFLINENDVPGAAGRGSLRTVAEDIAFEMISGVGVGGRAFPSVAAEAAIPGGDTPRSGVIVVPAQNRLNDGHHIVDVFEAIEKEHDLAVVGTWVRWDLPFRIDLLIVDGVMDAGIFNPGMADVGVLHAPLRPDYLFSIGSEMWIGAFGNGSTRPILMQDHVSILADLIPLSQVVDTARMEVAEWRDDKICGNCSGTTCSSRGWSLRCGQASNKQGEGDRLKKSRVV